MSRKLNEQIGQDWDDGSTIAPMDVDGMQADPASLPGMAPRIPWYSRRLRRDQPLSVDQSITPNETWKIIINAIAATLAIAAVFGVAGWLFIMFCIHVWFK